MSDAIDSYLASLRRELGTLADADDVVAEINDHLREAGSSATGADSTQAVESAIERLGEPALVARSVRMERGRLRGSDPIPVQGWAFTVAEVMLIVAAVVYGLASWLHHQPCNAGVDELGPVAHACLERWEASEVLPTPALPLGFDSLDPSPAAHVLFLVAVLLMAGSLAVFVPRQPWFAPLRGTAIALALLTLATGVAVLVNLRKPADGLPWWGVVAAVGVDFVCVFAAAQVWTEPPDLGRLDRVNAQRPSQSTSFSQYRCRASLIVLAAGGAGGFHLLQLLILGPLAALTDGIGHLLNPEWALPIWVVYQAHTVAVAVPAILSLLLSRSGRRRVAGSGVSTRNQRRNPKVTGKDSPVTLGAVRY